MTNEFATRFSHAWQEAWNSHDLDRIMAHYTDTFEMNSPVIQQLMNEASGQIKGKQAVRAYWEKALKLNPGLHFELLHTFVGVNSIVIHYKGHRGLSAETFFFDSDGKVERAYAHYEQ